MKFRKSKLLLSTIFLTSILLSCDLTIEGVIESYLDSSTLIYTSAIDIEDYDIDESIITINKNKSVSAYYYCESNLYQSYEYEGKEKELLEYGYSNYLKDLDVEEDLDLLVDIENTLRYQIYLNDNTIPLLTNLMYMVTGDFSDNIDALTIKYALFIYTYEEDKNVEIYLSFDNDDSIDVVLTTE